MFTNLALKQKADKSAVDHLSCVEHDKFIYSRSIGESYILSHGQGGTYHNGIHCTDHFADRKLPILSYIYVPNVSHIAYFVNAMIAIETRFWQ